MAYIPFDATEEEIAQMSIIREGIPTILAEPLKNWLAESLFVRSGYQIKEFALELQLELNINLGFTAGPDLTSKAFADTVFLSDEKMIMRVLDYLLYTMPRGYRTPSEELAKYLNLYRSKYAVVLSDNMSRVGYRVTEGLEETMQEAINAADATAGKLLAEAWEYAFGLDGKAEEAMDKAVKAVERAATPIVSPNDLAPSLGKAAIVVKQQGDWVLGLRSNDKAYPGVTLHHMMETLWHGQHYRHVDKNSIPPTIEQARVHVMLAATLVGWFASGQIVRDNALPQPKNWEKLQP
ncbi:hypothetical protein CVV68_16100 [Arthrobacter livingstonensis]|uniref:TIGR02391 family protein n=1 Tax=Arthrobacter livingstonensis TaxID=670078 RepID=A0A2V5L481_9MICC|nr:hypothetical protein [Arthrobacter livingstonensis]PYI65928.1 hypothetical protein CVV68_16100 [Arthrobacter livingstonensis]